MKIEESDKVETGRGAVKVVPMSFGDIGKVKQIETEANLAAWTENDYILEIDRPDSIALVAKVSEIIIGFIISRLIMSSNLQANLGEIANEVEIYNLAVSEKFRKRGIGQKLLLEIIRRIETESVESIWLEVRESNKVALGFYKKNGFEKIYTRKNFYINPLENALVLKLRLKKNQMSSII